MLSLFRKSTLDYQVRRSTRRKTVAIEVRRGEVRVLARPDLARLDQRLARLGLARATGETVMNHAHRVADVIPEVTASIVAVARVYEQIRYAGDIDPRLEKQLYSEIERCYSLLPSR